MKWVKRQNIYGIQLTNTNISYYKHVLPHLFSLSHF